MYKSTYFPPRNFFCSPSAANRYVAFIVFVLTLVIFLLFVNHNRFSIEIFSKFVIMKFSVSVISAFLAATVMASPTPTELEKRATTMCGNWGTVATGGFTVYHNTWGSGSATSGSQCTTFNSLSSAGKQGFFFVSEKIRTDMGYFVLTFKIEGTRKLIF